MPELAAADVRGDAAVLRGAYGTELVPLPHSSYLVECRAPDGRLLWTDEAHNLVTDEGARAFLNYAKAAVTTSGFYVGLRAAGTIAASDTAASHGGWTELTGYAETGRQILTLGTPAGRSVDNSAAKATFTITASATVAGFGLWTSSAKGGAGGSLYSASDFTGGSRGVNSGDALSVLVTLTA
jgi:hypothetical protein